MAQRIKIMYYLSARKMRDRLYHVPKDRQRITVKTVLLNFGELWGLGNRSIFTAIGHLLWRPGYMARDYISGKRSVYLQPVKTLVVTTLLTMQVAWLVEAPTPQWNPKTPKIVRHLQNDKELAEVSDNVKSFTIKAANTYDEWHLWLDKHRAFNILYSSILAILLVCLLFRKNGYNIAEITTAMIYFLAQLQVLTVVWLFLTRGQVAIMDNSIWLPRLIVDFVLLIDFKQLFQRSWCGTLWRTALILLLL